MKLLRKTASAIRRWFDGVVKTHRGPTEPKDDMRVVKSPDGSKYAVQFYSKWLGWQFYGFNVFDDAKSASEAITRAKKHQAEQKQRESIPWKPLNES